MLKTKEEVFVQIATYPDGMPVLDEVIVRYRKKKLHEVLDDINCVMGKIEEAWERKLIIPVLKSVRR